MPNISAPPKAPRIPHAHVLHGVTRPDDYYWLRERDNPAVIQYLTEENAYYDAVMAPLRPMAQRLYEEQLARIQQTDVEVPVQDGPYFYYRRTEEGAAYPIFARKRARFRDELDAAAEEVLLDQNALAAGKAFYSLTVQRVSPDHTLLAYLDNQTGTDRYRLHIKNLATGEMLVDTRDDVTLFGSLEWDPKGDALYCITVDPTTQRAHRLVRHRLGMDASADEVVYDETDPTYTLHVGRSQSGRFLFATSHSTTTHEVRYLDTATAGRTWHVFQPRRRGVRYTLEHWGDALLVLTDDHAPDMKLLAAPLAHLDDPSAWTELIGHQAGRPLDDVEPLGDAVLVSGREDGQSQLWVLDPEGLRRVTWPEDLYTVSPGDNRTYPTPVAQVRYESLVTPPSVYELTLADLTRALLKQEPVLGGYQANDYVQERVTVTAQDGVTQVPVSLVYRRGARDQGPAPLILDGYGSYGATSDPHFTSARLPLVNRGVVMAIAHVRGGGEMGRAWYEEGKLMHKRNTFTDFVDAARALVERGYTTPERLAARGRSAGGLLMGAVANLAPQWFQVIVAGVPFVDVLTTMLDDTIPLTSLEWDEWGDPHDADAFAYMATYSPYDNVAAQDYPHLYVHTGLNDPRVGYFEPAKWVARLRATKTDQHVLVLKTEMGAGHGGPSGRYNRLRDRAQEDAFVLHHLGIDT
ncbi:MAG: S9 family peptidase [Thermaerobacter sp.]|nr:S9 family peptidase [Thermaerobacter sp.]